jgi:hypothetical protein
MNAPVSKRYRLNVTGGLLLEARVWPDSSTIELLEQGNPAVIIYVDMKSEPPTLAVEIDGQLVTRRELREGDL